MIICGIDPSLSATGVVVSKPDDGPDAFTLKTFGSKFSGDNVKDRIRRFEDLIARIVAHLENSAVTHIYLEGYSLASKFNVTLLAEFGGLLRWNLLDVGEVTEIAPTTLKKFVTGAGNTKGKDLFAAAIVKRWGVMLDSSDAFDAYGAWRLGRACQNIDPCDNEAQRESVARVLGVDIPKKPKKRKLPKTQSRPWLADEPTCDKELPY